MFLVSVGTFIWIFLAVWALYILFLALRSRDLRPRVVRAIILITGAAIVGTWLLSIGNPYDDNPRCVQSIYVDKPLINSDDSHWQCLRYSP